MNEKRAVPDARDLARLFTRPVFRSLAQEYFSPVHERVATTLEALAPTTNTSLAELFERAYASLEDRYPNEYVYKNRIVSRLLFARFRPTTTSALLELSVASSVADVVILRDTPSVYEVKTDLDDFSRLPNQLNDYSKFSPMITVVASARRLKSIENSIDENVGLLAFAPRGRLSTVRPARPRLENLQTEVLFSTLRKSEQVAVLSNIRPLDKWGAAPRSERLAAFERRGQSDVLGHTTAELRSRGLSNVHGATSIQSFPPSLRALAYSEPLSRNALARLWGRLAGPIDTLRGD